MKATAHYLYSGFLKSKPDVCLPVNQPGLPWSCPSCQGYMAEGFGLCFHRTSSWIMLVHHQISLPNPLPHITGVIISSAKQRYSFNLAENLPISGLATRLKANSRVGNWALSKSIYPSENSSLIFPHLSIFLSTPGLNFPPHLIVGVDLPAPVVIRPRAAPSQRWLNVHFSKNWLHC